MVLGSSPVAVTYYMRLYGLVHFPYTLNFFECHNMFLSFTLIGSAEEIQRNKAHFLVVHTVSTSFSILISNNVARFCHSDIITALQKVSMMNN